MLKKQIDEGVFCRAASVLALVQSQNDSGSVDGAVSYSKSCVWEVSPCRIRGSYSEACDTWIKS